MSCARRIQNNRSKLLFRLTRTYARLFAATTLILSLIVYFVSAHFLLSRRREELADSAASIWEIYCEEVAEGHDPTDPQILRELNTSGNMSLALLSPAGEPLAEAANFSVDYADLPDGGQTLTAYAQSDGLPLLAWTKAAPLDGGETGTLCVWTRVDGEYAFLKMLAWLLILLNVGGVFAALAVGWYTSKRMLMPIAGIIRKAGAIGEGALHTRLEVPETDDELRLLTATLNDMLDRVEEAFVRQGQFTQDASHELRTPLAVLQGNADLLARWGKDDPAVRDKCIASIQRQVGYMNRLVENLLFLSREDSGLQGVKKEKLVLSTVFSEILADRVEIDNGHQYQLNVEEGLCLFADGSLIRQLILILLDNAAQYTPAGKAILLGAARGQSETEIFVRDEGCGVPPEQLANIFERFFRVDKARARKTGGTGLGLAIAKSIVRIHGGRIWAENGENCGLIIRAMIPNKMD